MNREQKVAWLFLALMGVLVAVELASRYLLEPGVATAARRTTLLVFLGASAWVLSRKAGGDAVEKDERSEMIAYRASWFGFMGAFAVVLLYSFVTVLWYERKGCAALSFQTLELILTRQAIIASIAMGVIRSVSILISYREGTVE